MQLVRIESVFHDRVFIYKIVNCQDQGFLNKEGWKWQPPNMNIFWYTMYMNMFLLKTVVQPFPSDTYQIKWVSEGKAAILTVLDDIQTEDHVVWEDRISAVEQEV